MNFKQYPKRIKCILLPDQFRWNIGHKNTKTASNPEGRVSE